MLASMFILGLPTRTLRLCVLIILITSILAGCRYWSMLRFAQQFCAYDESMHVLMSGDQMRLEFFTPVLPEPVFTRYFKARPTHASILENQNLHHRYVLRNTAATAHSFSVYAEFTPVSNTYLLVSGQLDAPLSATFGKDFAQTILMAACTESPDLGLNTVSVPMQLDMPPDALASAREIKKLFSDHQARYDATTQTLQVTLDFMFMAEDQSLRSQERPVTLYFGFEHERWQTLYVNYDQYSLWLDFTEGRGLLHAIRN